MHPNVPPFEREREREKWKKSKDYGVNLLNIV